jgi:AraC-like DNA-binding protein
MAIADGAFSKLSATPHKASRDKSDLAHISDEYLTLILQLTGQNVFRTTRDETRRVQGDITLTYCNQPFSIDILPGEPYSAAGIFFKKSLVADFLRPNMKIDTLNLSHLPLGPALIGCVSTLNRRLLIASESELSALYNASIALVIASVIPGQAGMEDIVTDRSRAREGILRSIKGFIEDSLREPLLSPAFIAARFGISVRYLHKLFENTGESFGDYVLAQRLEQAKLELRDPAYDRFSIAEIAHRWGFRDPSNFHRNFKQRFNATPRQIRSATN